MPKFAFLALIFILQTNLAVAGEPPILARIQTFVGHDSWGSISTTYAPRLDGRYQYAEVMGSTTAGSCGDLLAQFQKRSLDQMVEQGYISKKDRNSLMELQKLGIAPHQLVLVTLYSKMTRTEAQKYFAGPIPEERIIEDEDNEVKIFRGTLYAVRGYEIKSNGGKGVTLKPLKVPWELSPVKTLTRNFDRTKVPALIEIGRAFMEKGPLPGDFKTAMHLLIAKLKGDAKILKLDPSQVILTAHSLEAGRARLFAKLFPVRPLNDALQSQLENDPATTMSSYMDAPLPKGSEWAELDDLISYGSLAKASEQFPLADITGFGVELAKRSGGKLSPEQGLEYHAEFMNLLRADYTLSIDGREFATPIVTQDMSTARMTTRYRLAARRFGIDPAGAEAASLTEFIGEQSTNPIPDLLLEGSMDTKVPFPILANNPLGQDGFESLWIQNFDPREAMQFPMTYIAGALLAYDKLIRNWLENMSPEAYKMALSQMNETRQEKKMSPTRELSAQAFYETYPLMAYSTNPQVSQQLQILGGRATEIYALSVEAPKGEIDAFEKMRIKIAMVPSTSYKFDTKNLDYLREKFVNLNSQLHTREHEFKTRLLHTTIF